MMVDVNAIVKKFGGTILGDASTIVTGVASLDSAVSTDICFLRESSFLASALASSAGVLIVSPKFQEYFLQTMIITDHPHLYFSRVTGLFSDHKNRPKYQHRSSFITVDPSASIGESVFISPGVVIEENVIIGDHVHLGPGVMIMKNSIVSSGTILHAHVVVYPDVHIGKNCLVHASVVLGSDGFGFDLDDNHHWVKIPQIAGVIIGDDCELGASVTIDCGALDPTTIGHGVKLDNRVHVGHGVHVGDHTAIAAGTAIAGCTRIGRHCRIGGMSAINRNIVLEDYVTVLATSTVMRNIAAHEVYNSIWPAMPYNQWWRLVACVKRLATQKAVMQENN